MSTTEAEIQTDIFQEFHDWVTTCVDAKGVYPYPALIHKRENGKLTRTIVSLAMDNPDAAIEAIHQMIELDVKQEIVDVIFGIDRTMRPGQGTVMDDVLTISHWRPGHAWRYGIIEYSYNQGDKVVRPIDWDNDFWRLQQWIEQKAWVRSNRPMVIAVKRADGIESLLGLEGLSIRGTLRDLIKSRTPAICLPLWPPEVRVELNYKDGAVDPWAALIGDTWSSEPHRVLLYELTNYANWQSWQEPEPRAWPGLWFSPILEFTFEQLRGHTPGSKINE